MKFPNIFCDRLKMYQKHAEKIPHLAGELTFRTDPEGQKVKKYWYRYRQHKGSFESSLLILSDAESRTVHLSGNPGRFGRPDNVVNYGIEDTIQIANELLSEYGIPPFTPGEVLPALNRSTGEVELEDSGAKIQNTDTTMNIETGSRKNALATINSFRVMKFGRLELNKNGNHKTSLMFGNSGYKAVKIYVKSDDVRKRISSLRKTKNYRQSQPETRWLVDYLETLAQYLDDTGAVRLELTGRDMLARKGLNQLRNVNDDKMIQLFNQEVIQKMHDTQIIDDPKKLPKKLQATYYLFMSGQPVREIISRATYFRHKEELLAYGIDISQPPPDKTVVKFRQAIKVIEMQPLTLPDWYQFPKSV